MDWAKWKRTARAPTAYEAIGFRPGYVQKCARCNWYGLRSPLGECGRCSAGGACAACLGAREYDLRDADLGDEADALVRALRYADDAAAGGAPCPPELRGVYWLRDLTQHSSLLTLHDARWRADARGGIKRLHLNWARASTCLGASSSCVARTADACGVRLAFEVSPDGRWILFRYPVTCCGGERELGELGVRQWIYVFPRDGALLVADGAALAGAAGDAPAQRTQRVRAGDMMRIDFAAWDDPTSAVTYSYLVQRVDGTSAAASAARAELRRRLEMHGAEPLLLPPRWRIRPALAPRHHLVPAQRMQRA